MVWTHNLKTIKPALYPFQWLSCLILIFKFGACQFVKHHQDLLLKLDSHYQHKCFFFLSTLSGELRRFHLDSTPLLSCKNLMQSVCRPQIDSCFLERESCVMSVTHSWSWTFLKTHGAIPLLHGSRFLILIYRSAPQDLKNKYAHAKEWWKNHCIVSINQVLPLMGGFPLHFCVSVLPLPHQTRRLCGWSFHGLRLTLLCYT